MDHPHFLLVCFPFQSHINSTLRLANKLTGAGARVTLATTVDGLNNLKTLPGLSCDSFSDGHDHPNAYGKHGYFQEIKVMGSINLKTLVLKKTKEGQKVDFIIYGMCLPWVAEVARELNVPSAFFFFQSAASFSMAFHFMKNDCRVVNSEFDVTSTVKIPGLPLLKHSDIPDFLQPIDSLAPVFQQHIQTLEKHPNPLVLINTFDGLEEESIKAIADHMNIFSIGPLLSGETEDSDTEAYIRWLDSKPAKSVVYVSFGSFVELQKKQKEEMFQGLIEGGQPFLWVIRNQGEDDEVVKNYTGGLIVRWCSQVKVLNHVAIGCFVTHCGWNSLVESVVGGVPVVGCPQFGDQMVNAKMVEKVWGNGVKAVADSGGMVGKEEMKRCLEVVMGGGEMSEVIKENCVKLKRMAVEVMAKGGALDTNLKQFLQILKSV